MQYGDFLIGPDGIVFDLGDGVQIAFSARDYLFDPATNPAGRPRFGFLVNRPEKATAASLTKLSDPLPVRAETRTEDIHHERAQLVPLTSQPHQAV